jgi:hypothetical protein
VIPSVEISNAWDATYIQSQQEGDFAISQLKQWLKNGDRPNINQLQPNSELIAYFRQFQSMELRNELIYRKFVDSHGNLQFLQLVVPLSM